jgi:parallel beta-helix repeat protein
MKRGWFVLVLVAVLFFATGLVSVAAVNCGDTITSSITLTENLSCSGFGLTIAEDNVTIDCNGYRIIGEGGGYGLYSTSTKTNITVKNCIISRFNMGIYFWDTVGANIFNNNISNNNVNLYFDGLSFSNITNNTLNYATDRAMLFSGYSAPVHNNTVKNNFANYNNLWGLNLMYDVQNNEFENNTFCFNGDSDIDLYLGSNNFGSNTFDTAEGLSETNPLIKSNSCVFPEFVQGQCGQFLNSNLTLTEDITGCLGNGIKVYTDNITINCNGHKISGVNKYSSGIFNSGYDNIRIENCNISDFEYGIRIYASEGVVENLIIDNSTLYNNYQGIYFDGTIDSNVTNSIFDSNTDSGIHADSSSGNNFLWNNYTNNNYGLYLDEYSDNNSILDSRFISNNYGFYLNYADNNQIGRNYVDSTQYNFGEPSGSSCPFLYTWNGSGYSFISDMSTEGKLNAKTLYPDDYLKIDGNQLQPQDDKYNLQVTEEYDEISFIDQLKLITVDHSPDVDVFNGLTRQDSHSIYTVSKNPSPIVSCVDVLGNDCLSAVSAKDGIFTMSPVDNVTNLVTLNLGNLSGSPEIKLIVSYSWVNGYSVNNSKKSIQIKNESGDWVTIMADYDLTARAALQKTYVLNLTNRFLTDDYSVRFVLPIHAIDYIALDTTSQQEVIINEYNPLTADLHYRGYSDFIKNITKIFFYNTLIERDFSTPSGNFTKYGDVSSLVDSTDDKYAIISHGDEISVSFAYEPVAEGLERDFLMFEYAYYKPASLDIGKQVEPLPFRAMSKYPYNETEIYPLTQENKNYLSEYNTRQIVSERFGGSLPFSINNTVFENTFIVPAGMGTTALYLYDEINTSLLNNNISGEGLGIYLDSSTRTIVRGNNIAVALNAIYIQASSSNEIKNNTFNTSSLETSAIFVNDASSDNNILHNIVVGKYWVSDYNEGNYYNDSYSGNTYYFEDGSPSWDYYTSTDTNNDGWADSGNLPINSSISGGPEFNNLTYPTSYSNSGEWADTTPVYDEDLSTGGLVNSTASSAQMWYGFTPIGGALLDQNLTISTDLGFYNISIPGECINQTNEFGTISIDVNLSANSEIGLNIYCYTTNDIWTNPDQKQLIFSQVGISTFNGSQMYWELSMIPWIEYGEDWHPAITSSPSIRSITVSLISPSDNAETLGLVDFIFNSSTGFESQEIGYCNLTATSNILRASEISPASEVGLVGLWHFNNDLLDSSGNGNNGEAVNDASFSSDSKFGAASEVLDGVDDYVNISDSDSLDSVDLTVSAWIKYSGSDDEIIWNRIISKKTAWFDEDGFEITMVDSSDSQIYVAGSGDLPNVQVSCVDSWSNNSWHHIAVVYQGSLAYVYCDGSFKGSGAINPIVANDRPLFFGGMQGQYFNGQMDEVAIWNRSLSADEVNSLYNVNYRNSSSLITKDINQTLSLNLSSGNYTWDVSCTDDANVVGTSETRNLTISGSTIVNQTAPAHSSYAPQTYFSDVNLPSIGNNFNMGYNDKIKFVARLQNHTLTLNNFNSSTAKVIIQSNPIIAYLQKGIMYEFDLNNDSTNEVRVRYDGMNKSKAMIFIQEIKVVDEQVVKDNNIIQDFFEKKIEGSSWKVFWIIVLIGIVVLFFVWKKYKKQIEEFLWIRGIERSRRKRKHYSFY